MAIADVEAPAQDPAQEISHWRPALARALGVDAVLCLGFMMLIGEPIPPLIIFAALFAGFAFAVGRASSRWTVIVAGVLSVLFIVGNLPFIVADLSHPNTTAGFVPTVLLLVTTLFVILASVMTVRRSGGSPRVPAAVFAGVALLATVVSVVAAASVEDDVRQAGDVVVIAEDTKYPSEVDVDSGGAVFVDNKDLFHHTFVVDGTDLKVAMPGSAARRLPIDLDPGTYAFRCDVPGHEQMEGTLTVS